MAYIAPNSDVWICRGVPLDSRSKYSYRPSSKDEQFQSFSAYAVYTLNSQSYIRHSNNSIRVALAPDSLLTCNYMLFRNTSFGNKIFYAFITDVEYVNNETSLITYSIDNIQTYFFDVSFNASYIEREHSITDNIGDSVTPEPVITSGQEIYSLPKPLQFSESGLYTVIVTTKNLLNPTTARVYTTFSLFTLAGLTLAGSFNVCNVTSDNLSDFVDVITSYIENAGGISEILAIYSIPKTGYTAGEWDSVHTWLAPNARIQQPDAQYISIDMPSVGIALDGYTPKNNKLYTYPFCFLRITDYRGATKDLRYEYMTSESQLRLVNSGILPSPSAQLSCNYYAGTDNQMSNWDNSLIVSDFPTPTLTVSEFSEYYGNTHNSQIATQIANIGSSIMGAVSAVKSPATAVSNLSSSVTDLLEYVGQNADLQNNSLSINGFSGGYLSRVYGRDSFGSYRVCYNSDMLRQYDDFFTMYGYAVNTLKVPQFAQSQRRKAYNYCKTKNACIRSLGTASLGVPDTAIKDIQSALDGGLCLWETLANVGNYSVDNAL